MSDQPQRVRIVQCLCPVRHCIVALPYVPTGQEQMPPADELRGLVDKLIAEKQIDPWCGICRSERSQWTFEDAPTVFATIDQAMPALMRVAAEQAVTRERFRAAKN